MPLEAIESESLPDKVFGQLTQEIVSGRYKPGMQLLSERQLTAVFHVNRHVVREALKRLEQIGLIRITQGGLTTVLDYRESAGLDLLAVAAEHAEALDGYLPLLKGAMEMRAGIGTDIARLCAERADEAVRRELVELADLISRRKRGRIVLDMDRRFWQRMVDGADNLAYQLAFNSLIRGVHAVPNLSIPWLEYELQSSDYRRPIAKAIAGGDPDAAVSATRAALEPAVEIFATLADQANTASG